MKLEKRISIFNFLLTAGVLLIAAVLLFGLLLYQFKEMDNRLILNNMDEVVTALKGNTLIEDLRADKKRTITLITELEVKYSEPEFKEFTIIPNPEQPNNKQEKNKFKPPKNIGHYTVLTTDIQAGKQWYRIAIERIIPARRAFFTSLAITISLTFFALFGILHFGNKKLINKLLQPFHLIIQQIENFNIQQITNPKPTAFKVDEFQLLNNKTNYLMQNANTEYKKLKEFSENASHELQTPIAIVKAKLDLLLQSENIREHEMEQILLAQTALNKMSKLNKTLLLLNKLGNEEFKKTEQVNIKLIVSSLTKQMQEMATLKGIVITEQLNDVIINNNKYLIELLITNLLSNAINHNTENGYINIRLNNKFINITNTGKPLAINVEELFTRFKKNNQSQQSTGLGLAIVKKICDISKFTIKYRNNEELHEVEITFN